jgi:hypothetical protein
VADQREEQLLRLVAWGRRAGWRHRHAEGMGACHTPQLPSRYKALAANPCTNHPSPPPLTGPSAQPRSSLSRPSSCSALNENGPSSGKRAAVATPSASSWPRVPTHVRRGCKRRAQSTLHKAYSTLFSSQLHSLTVAQPHSLLASQLHSCTAAQLPSCTAAQLHSLEQPHSSRRKACTCSSTSSR